MLSISISDKPGIKRNNRLLCTLRRNKRRAEGFSIDPVNLWNEDIECHSYFYNVRDQGYPRDGQGKFVKRWNTDNRETCQ